MSAVSSDFYEDDEPVDKVRADYAQGEPGVTGRAVQSVHTQYLALEGLGVVPAAANQAASELVKH